ncbi:DUF3618 domain-containing protein [Kineococcus sp. R86509]|uniref:DUF3618 domain-containing protein n=1 Tax=Kineococcus sp. R86509 TaxID=3093851 RepID=UPI0036D3F6A1
MSDSLPNSAVPTDRAGLERDIAETRARLASTADALAAKADVKAQASAKVEDVKAKVHEVSAGAPGSGTQQSGVLIAGIVVVTALAVWLVVRKR